MRTKIKILACLMISALFVGCLDVLEEPIPATTLPTELISGSPVITVEADTVATLSALPLEAGLVGEWKIISDNGNLCRIQSTTSPTSKIYGKFGQDYTLRWTVKNGEDSVHNDIQVRFLGIYTDPRDNQQYKLTKIGNQIWMAENFRYAANIADTLYYNKDANYGPTYGGLYTLPEALALAPQGWRLPNAADVALLVKTVQTQGRNTLVVPSVVGFNGKEATALKADTAGFAANMKWNPASAKGINYFGLNICPAGMSTFTKTDTKTVATNTTVTTSTFVFSGSQTGAYIWCADLTGDVPPRQQHLQMTSAAGFTSLTNTVVAPVITNTPSTGTPVTIKTVTTTYRRSVRYLKY
ncbi:MAG: FISUMP domain-containing protein [Bacteroidales bacterium]|nr:FISUMP domain-containing protein [Bacteroidales bacterium]